MLEYREGSMGEKVDEKNGEKQEKVWLKREGTEDGMQKCKIKWKAWRIQVVESEQVKLRESFFGFSFFLIRRGPWAGSPVQWPPWQTAWRPDPCRCSGEATPPPGSRCGHRGRWWGGPGWDFASQPPLEWLQRTGKRLIPASYSTQLPFEKTT